ncbi:winged helix-turn-helix domain-containing protein [Novosphingobium sp. JCM 18896]|uniref:winged helix-turn-helix domain-containing protein n=1 Tax=Novosphingobium sp. JCM 18896 TaxID=2989731 RepID=UPI0022226D52|nr:crosslink repair DNA glycosylase YcaQ family protein [Novosphingobium sp. JCM 18896]MCW1430228.1 winged helix DNA-binding domain-containing protein [Novosphingobium sp. JCM 18896]
MLAARRGHERMPPMTIERIGLPLARRMALAAQGFGRKLPDKPGSADLMRALAKIQLHQIDSVNVLSRAHYLPAFSRLGAYDRADLDNLAWGPRRKRRLFEYWAHEASLLPVELQPLLRWRMAAADRGETGWGRMRLYATERRAEAMALLDRIRIDGPLAASDFESHKGQSGWWEWSDTKRALEWLFWAGHITTATRRGSFERVYDLTERVIPAHILSEETPGEAQACLALIERAAKAHGIATAADLRDYFRLSPEQARTAIAGLVEEGVLIPVNVPGWRDTWIHRDARRPRTIKGQALLAPFDPLIWSRDRVQRLFGFHYRIEIYVPAEKRKHGYYVLPFLLGDRLVARVDLKADRQASRLLVQTCHFEPDAPRDAAEALRAELGLLARWLGLGGEDYCLR